MMADAMELRDAKLLENFKEVRPCPAIVERDETMMFLGDKQLRGKNFLLLGQAIPRRPCIQSDFADGGRRRIQQGLFEPRGAVVRPFVDEERMEADGGMDVRLFAEFCNSLPFREMRRVGENAFDAMRATVLQDCRKGILYAAVRQMGMCIVERKQS